MKAEANGVYGALRRYLTTCGPGGGPAVTPAPATLMSRLSDDLQDAVAAQVNRSIEGRPTRTDPQTWYAIRQGLTGDDANVRQRWASTNLVQFTGRLSDEDVAALEKLQTAVRTNDGGADQNRRQAITRMANQALRSAGIDPTPRPDAGPGSDAAQAAMFHRALHDELSALKSRGRTPTQAESYDIVNALKDTGIKSGWLKVSDPSPSPTVASDVPSTEDKALPAQADPSARPAQNVLRLVAPGEDFETFHRRMEEERQREAAEQAATATGGAKGAPATEPESGSPEYRTADAQARALVTEQGRGPSEVGRAETPRSASSRGASMAVPVVPGMLPGATVLGKLADAVLQAARSAASFATRVAPAAAGITAGAAAEAFGGALALMVIPTNSQAEFERINDDLRVRIPLDQPSATVQLRVDNGLFGIGAKWIDLRVGAAWTFDKGRRYVAIDRHGLEQAIGREAADAALGGNGIAMAKPPSKKGSDKKTSLALGITLETSRSLHPALATKIRNRR